MSTENNELHPEIDLRLEAFRSEMIASRNAEQDEFVRSKYQNIIDLTNTLIRGPENEKHKADCFAGIEQQARMIAADRRNAAAKGED